MINRRIYWICALISQFCLAQYIWSSCWWMRYILILYYIKLVAQWHIKNGDIKFIRFYFEDKFYISTDLIKKDPTLLFLGNVYSLASYYSQMDWLQSKFPSQLLVFLHGILQVRSYLKRISFLSLLPSNHK